MNLLPHISHHLFVAAVGHEDAPKTASEVSGRSARPDMPDIASAAEIPLELLDGGKPMPAEAARHVSAPSRMAS